MAAFFLFVNERGEAINIVLPAADEVQLPPLQKRKACDR